LIDPKRFAARYWWLHLDKNYKKNHPQPTVSVLIRSFEVAAAVTARNENNYQ